MAFINQFACNLTHLYLRILTCIERVPGPAGHHTASCELFIGKACLCSNDRFIDSILSMIDMMRVNFECVE